MTCKKLSEVGDVITHPHLEEEWVVVSVYGKGSMDTQTIALMKLKDGSIDWSVPQITHWQAVSVDTLLNNHMVVRNLIRRK